MDGRDRHDEVFAALMAPFGRDEVKARQAPGGRRLSYITARTAMNRLDDVLGGANWWDEYVPLENAVLCKLSVCLPDGRVVTKCDAGGHAGMADQGDDEKSGYSDSFKRAAAKFGVGRYLYGDGLPPFAAGMHKDDDRGLGWDDRPPAREPGQDDEERPREQQGRRQERDDGPRPSGPGYGAPRTGKALFAWVKAQETDHEVGLLKYLNNWARLQEFPGRMVDWDADEVARAYAEGARKLRQVLDSVPG